MFDNFESGISVAEAALMTQPGFGSRRWAWTFLFVLAGTISMVGPTQAVSGLVTASVTVMAALSRVLGPSAASGSAVHESSSPSGSSAQQFSSGSQIITIERAVVLMDVQAGLSSLSDSAVTHDAGKDSGDTGTSTQGGGVGSGGRRSAASGGSGGGGFGGGGASGTASDRGFDPAAIGTASAASEAGSIEALSVVGVTDELTSKVMAAIVGGSAGSESVIEPATGGGDVTVESVVQSLLGSTSGSTPFEHADDVLFDSSQSSKSASESSASEAGSSAPAGSGPKGTPGVSPFAGPDVQSAMGLSQPLVVDDGDSRDQAMNDRSPLALADAGNSGDASAGGGVGVAQVPEPSGLVLLSLGVAAALRHTRRR